MDTNTETAGNAISLLLSQWRADGQINLNVSAWRTLPAREAKFVPFPQDLHPALTAALAARGITRLYSHQAASLEHARDGRHVVVVTGTASGKTLCYNLPVLDRMLQAPQARALYLFPTKALAQDQVTNLKELVQAVKDAPATSSPRDSASRMSIGVAAYDGDTPEHNRPAIRGSARIVVSNPDMLHAGILPHHTLWVELLRHLEFVVVDEMHAYRGVFGSHVANVLRRLKRVAGFYGSTPRFILTSATIANPGELAEKLIEEPITLVDDDGAARGEKHFVIYNPPIVDRALGLRRSALLEGVRLGQELLSGDVQTIVFARSRQSVEVMVRYLSTTQDATRNRARDGIPPADLLPNAGGGRSEQQAIVGYRSGYLPAERRGIERGLRQGRVRAVVATNALELGIDIGGMGAAVLVGYPGTIAATWQQAGRAGRAAGTSLAVLIATADPLDQFLAHHPDYFFTRSPEQALVNPDNLLILLQHIRCAAFELPFQERERFGRVEPSQLSEFLQFLEENGVLHQSGDKYFWMSDQYPSDGISLRSASGDRVVLDLEGQTIGEVDLESAYWMVHPQAIYLQQGQTYAVEALDLEHKIARLKALDTDYYTEPRKQATVRLLNQLAQAEATGATKAYGEIAVTTQVVGYKKVRWFTHETLGEGEVSLPPTELHTTGYWLALNETTVEHLREQGLWTNDANDYGPEWNVRREEVRERDHYRCQICGTPETDRAHHVHHKVPFRSFSSRTQANQPDNLVTLCPACHRRAEQAVALRSGLGGLAHALGHLAPFFLMCDSRDIGVHSDPQSPLAEGKPTVVIYDSVPAGIGFSERLYELHGELIERARELVSECECDDGCPSCVGPGGESGYGGKRETIALLQALI
ncbi:MAG: DEAD/DEAH box helicase [Chloroflexi bacterium]|nr:DEAD/DEAH box helicase [Chloroflexota bacterium]